MIMTVDELRRYVNTDEEDQVLEARLQALALLIQGYTNNNFHKYEVDGVIEYPMDIKMGVVNLMKWDMNNRDKVGVQSESISRHSVAYYDMGTDNSVMGYPKALMGFLKPYMRARFGRGIGV